MDKNKLEFAKDVLHIIQDLGKVVYDIHSDEDLEKILGLTKEQMQIVVRRLINSLPDKIFIERKERQDEIKKICARELIFFQAQEKWSDPHYKHDLLNFLHSFARDMKQ